MAAIYLTSVKGAPGVTSTALALALTWPRPVLLMEADPAGSGILAGYLRGGVDHTHGLTNVSLAFRQGAPIETAALDQTLRLTDHVLVLPGIADPAQAPTLTTTWAPLAEACRQFESAGMDVIVDAGRIGSAYAPTPLMRACDVVALVTRTQLPDVYALSRRAPSVARDLAGGVADDALRVLVVGPGRPYGAREIQDSVGVQVLAPVAWDPESAEVLSVGAVPGRRFATGPLMRSAAAVVSETTALVNSRRRRLATTGTDPAGEQWHG